MRGLVSRLLSEPVRPLEPIEALARAEPGVRSVRELAELAGDEVGDLLADVDGVVADPLEAP